MGVPTLGCQCATCTSADPRDNRTRPSISVTWPGSQTDNRVLIDTGPDFRTQALREGIRHVDAVFYTHSHADHILGLDDLRPLSFMRPGKMPLYADDATARVLERIFEYTFSPESTYPTRARVALHRLEGEETAEVCGLTFQRIPLMHGRLAIAGYRFGPAAYLTDMNLIPERSLELLAGVDTVIVDALRITAHPSHANLEEAIRWVDKIGARRAYFTHMSHEIKHAEIDATLPERIRLAYDGLRVQVPFQGKA
jgi:phosphoribosyl 1,2-cyclic phosphate phosphodiesterase